MATHSTVLSWGIPWTEEPGGLQSMESQRVDVTKHVSTHGMRSRLISLPTLTRQQCVICVIYFSGECAGGYVMSTFFAKQHHSCRTTQGFK